MLSRGEDKEGMAREREGNQERVVIIEAEKRGYLKEQEWPTESKHIYRQGQK